VTRLPPALRRIRADSTNPSANEAFYQTTQTYALAVVNPQTADKLEGVAIVHPEWLGGAPKASVARQAAFSSPDR